MQKTFKDLNLELAHIGINPGTDRSVDALCQFFSMITGQSIRDNNSSFFVSNYIEVMKNPWKGTHGHIAFWTDDITAAVDLLSAQGCAVDMSSAQYYDDGAMRVVYLAEEYGGFAVHLMQRR